MAPPARAEAISLFIALRIQHLSTLFPYTTLFRSSSERQRSSVDFPEPDGPMITFTCPGSTSNVTPRSEEHTSELQSRFDLVCRLLLEKKKQFRHGATSKSRSNTFSNSTKHKSHHL